MTFYFIDYFIIIYNGKEDSYKQLMTCPRCQCPNVEQIDRNRWRCENCREEWTINDRKNRW